MVFKAQDGVDLFCDGAMFIGRTIYIMQQDRLGEWSGLKPVFPYKVLIDEHSGCSGVQEGVAMEVREVREVSSTWRLREHAEVSRRMQAFAVGVPNGLTR